jgi:C4-dicarboxylate-binding protein DctP
MLITSDRWWNDLPEDIRSELSTILAEVTSEVNALASAKNEADKQAIMDSGKTEILSLTADEKAAWRAAMKPVWEEFAGDIGANYIDAAAACNP